MQIHEVRAKVEELHQEAKTELDFYMRTCLYAFNPHVATTPAAREYVYMQVLELFKKMW